MTMMLKSDKDNRKIKSLTNFMKLDAKNLNTALKTKI